MPAENAPQEPEHAEAAALEALLAAMAPPDHPSAAGSAMATVADWKRTSAVCLVAGLMTEPRFQANTIRLDWLQRLIVGAAEGRLKPKRAELAHALNNCLAQDNILHLEDPVEDFFCDVVPASSGEALIFTGHWERPAAYTHTLIRAFESLADALPKQRALAAAEGLLRLSGEIARRAGVERHTYNAGAPGARVDLPDIDTLKEWAKRVRFTSNDLEGLSIDRSQLTPYILKPEQFAAVARTKAGNSALDFQPLLEVGEDIVVASPGSISLAVRSHLMLVAKAGGVERSLLKRLAVEQQEFSEFTGFWPTTHLQMENGPHGLRACVCVFAPGRYLHVIQAGVGFETFPNEAFGSVAELDPRANAEIGTDIERFWSFLAEREDHRESMTLLLVGGWGTGLHVAPPIPNAGAPSGWRFKIMSFAEAATFGAAEDGKLRDLWRIAEQEDKLEADGFVLQNMNGALNLFGHWRRTDGNILPEHWLDARPPCFIALAPDALFEPLTESARNQDLRTLRFVNGAHKLVQRVDWGDYFEPAPLYGSLHDIAHQRLLGCARVAEQPWWVECKSNAEPPGFEFQYNVWKAVLHWISRAGPALRELEPELWPERPLLVEIQLTSNGAFRAAHESQEFEPDLASTITSTTEGDDTIIVEIGDAWGLHLQDASNAAEATLATRILREVASLAGGEIDEARALAIVRHAVPSPDWRWLHAHPAETPAELMVSAGLIGKFHEVPLSAVALIKCGDVWRFRSRDEGAVITGEDECRAFLSAYLDHTRDQLIASIRKYDREALLLACAAAYQAARREQMSWSQTIRAMRSIHGPDADSAAFKRQNDINAVLRCSKVVLEVAACEATPGGAVVAREDLDELAARAMLWFGHGQVLACIRGGLVAPELRISPAGDLMTDRSVVKKALEPAAEVLSRRSLDDAADHYLERHRVEAPEAAQPYQWDVAFAAALQEEYGLPAQSFVQLSYALVDLARARQQGEFLMRQSELVATIGAHEGFDAATANRLIGRLTLPCRTHWTDIPAGLPARAYDVSRFDRPQSLIGRPLAAVTMDADPLLVVAPILVADAIAYAIGGLRNGQLQDDYWVSAGARAYAGQQGAKAGDDFEDVVGDAFEELRFRTIRGRKVEGLLREAVEGDLGDVDVLAISPDERHVFVIEAKNLRFCRTEAEVAARMYEYRGKVRIGEDGRERADKMFKHLRRTRYLRTHAQRLGAELGLAAAPVVIGAVVVDAPQPMNFHTISEEGADAEVWMVAALGEHVTAAMSKGD